MQCWCHVSSAGSMQAGVHDRGGARGWGARAQTSTMPERPMIIVKLGQRLKHSDMTTCKHMQQTGRQTELSEASLARSREEAAQGDTIHGGRGPNPSGHNQIWTAWYRDQDTPA